MDRGYRETEPITRLHSVPELPKRTQLEWDIIGIKRDIERIKTLTWIRFTVEFVVAFTIVIAALYVMHEVSILMASDPVSQHTAR